MRSCTGGSAAEFALVLPILTMFLLGMVDVGRLMWTWNQAEKATQMGARYAVVTGPVATDMIGYSFVTSGGLQQGDPIPATYGTMACSMTGANATCACTSGSCAWGTTASTPALTNIATRMSHIFPAVAPANVVVEYGPTDLGFAGDPNGSDAAPLVTVSLRNIMFTPFLFQVFPINGISLPDFRASLTLEDAAGAESN